MRPPFGATVPGNRWDLVARAHPDPLPSVSVVIAHYRQQAELDRTLAALARQDYPSSLVQIIVADDGSPTLPVVPEGVELVRQDDRGFRLAAARNLGVQRASGQVLCFLDADTAPEPGYLRELTRLPALLPEAVTVGRRRHADFGGHSVHAPVETAGPASALPEPAWLSDAYARSRNLLDADDRSYRYIIGAVFSCSRWFFDEVGGFDESFDEYGGEDWEWAHRAWQNGAILAHVPTAVAWHDGPEWAERAGREEERVRRGNAQTLRLARMIPVDGSRGTGLLAPVADVAFRLGGRHEEAASFVFTDSVLAAFPRARVELEHGAEAAVFAPDPRVVRLGAHMPVPRVVVEVARPFALIGQSPIDALAGRIRTLGSGEEWELELSARTGEVLARAVSARARTRKERWGDDAGFSSGRIELDGLIALGEHPRVEPFVGGWGSTEHLQ